MTCPRCGREASASTGQCPACREAVGPANTGPLGSGQSFGTRYHIIRLLGIGGMGAVYQAWDAELNVTVAIKVIRPDVMSDPSAAAEVERRFKRELLLARQVTHKHVVRIHDLGEIGGIKYITMPYMEGADLATVMGRKGALPVPRALRIARGIASGLAAAHDAGVVHRDLKPANIMIDADDEAVIMDFGIALSTGKPAAETVTAITLATGAWPSAGGRAEKTGAGTVLGTLEYMAPEQATGAPVDLRVDIYAFGLIVYDMLTGGRGTEPNGGALGDLQSRMRHPPPSMRSTRPAIPDGLDRLVLRCLEPDPAKRYPTTAALTADLARLDDNGQPMRVRRVVGVRAFAAVIAIALALLTATWWYGRRPLPPAAPHDPLSVLVADFANDTNDPAFDGALEQALGISIEGAAFITAYPRGDALKVAKSTRLGERLDEKVARLVAVREGVTILVAGAIAREGTAYRVTVLAIDPTKEGDSRKPFARESMVARDKTQVLPTISTLAGKLRAVLGDTTPGGAGRAAAETFTTASLDAMQAYTRAQELAWSNHNEEAMQEYRRAVTLDPAFGRAYAGIAVLYTILKDEPKARAAYEEAFKHLDRMTDREKYRTLGTYYASVARNYEKAIETYQTLVKQYPADEVGHGNLALAYFNVGNLAGAVTEVREALRIYPRNSLQRYNYAMYSLYAGDFTRASAEGRRVTKEAPSFPYAFLPVALSAGADGNAQAALDTYAALERAGSNGQLLAALGRADLAMYHGRYLEALRLLEDASTTRDGDPGILGQEQVALAQVYLGLGRPREAAEAALKAAASGTHESLLVPAARVLVAAGRVDEARTIAVTLEKMLQTQTIAYSRLIAAEVALKQGRYVDAIEALRDSIRRRDTWTARFVLGKAYTETDHFAEGMAELDLCLKRRGEGADAFFYDTPTLRYLPPVYYWLARAQQGMGIAGAQKSYERFLAIKANADPADPLVADARRRLPPSTTE